MFLKKANLFLVLFLFNIYFNPTVFAKPLGDIYILSDELTVKKIKKDIYIINHRFPWPANSMLVRCSDKDFVWVDTPYNNEATKQVLDWVESIFGNVRIVEINTGFHNDNLGGNGFLKQKGIDIYGSHLTKRLLTEQADKTRQQLLKWLEKPQLKKYYHAHATAKYTEPNQLYKLKDGLQLNFDGKKVEVFYPGASHTLDNVVVYFPDKKLLFAGCLVKSINNTKLGYIVDANMKQWPVSLKKILAKFSQAQIVVPGHGAVGGIELIKHTLSLF